MKSVHDVTNQPPVLVDYNLFTSHPVLVDALAREGAAGANDQLVPGKMEFDVVAAIAKTVKSLQDRRGVQSARR